MPSLSAYNIIRIYSKVEDYETENKTLDRDPNTTERKCGRRELGLPTSSAAVHPRKICDAAYDVPSYANFL